MASKQDEWNQAVVNAAKATFGDVVVLTLNPTTAAREAAHQAVKAFDLNPDLTNTTAAIEALSEYEQHLKEQR